MKIRYIRIFTCEIPKDEVLAALKQKIDEWGYDESDERHEMGISDLLHELQDWGLLRNEIEEDEYPEIVSDEWSQAFYTLDEMEEELKDIE